MQYLRQPLCQTGFFACASLMCAFLAGCISTARERELQNDIFTLKTRIVELEGFLLKNDEKGDENESSLSKRIASTNTGLDRMDVKIKKLTGEVETLRVGVMTGQIPGTEATTSSVASRLDQIELRLEAIEEAQLAMAKNGARSGSQPKSNQADGGKERKSSSLSNLADFTAAFEKKRYKQVVEEGGAALRNMQGGDKSALEFMMAESTYKLGNIRDAALKFNDLVESNPSDDVKKRALLRLGDSFRHLGDTATAKLYYSELTQKFSGTEEAATAQERLTELDNG